MNVDEFRIEYTHWSRGIHRPATTRAADLALRKLRHSFAANYLMACGDIFALKELLGHSQLATTQIYSHLTQSHLAAEAEKVMI